MASRNLLDENSIVFEAKPEAVPYNYRISYKVSQLCLIINTCSNRGCSLIKIHMISYALCSRDSMDKLIYFVTKDNSSAPVVRFDPAVNKALNFAVADKLIEQQKNGNYKLTSKGNELVRAIDYDATLMFAEKRDLATISKNLSEVKIEVLSDTWRKIYAEN